MPLVFPAPTPPPSRKAAGRSAALPRSLSAPAADQCPPASPAAASSSEELQGFGWLRGALHRPAALRLPPLKRVAVVAGVPEAEEGCGGGPGHSPPVHLVHTTPCPGPRRAHTPKPPRQRPAAVRPRQRSLLDPPHARGGRVPGAPDLEEYDADSDDGLSDDPEAQSWR
eukprot:EG_transcript_33349